MEESSQLANEGKVVIGGLADPHGHGHILATEPGPWQAAGGFMANGKMARVTPEKYPPAMSSSLGSYQGAKSRGEKTVYDAWGPEYFPQVTFWVHE